MKKIKILLVSLTVLAVTNSFAQKSDDSKSSGPTLSVGLEAGLPIGKFGDSHKFGIGGSVKAGIPIFDGGDATISAGYMTFSGKSETISLLGVSETFKNPNVNIIPLKAGLRFKIAEGFYGEPQLGVSLLHSKEESIDENGAATSVSSNKSYFTYAAGVGYMINKMIDIGVRYEAFSTKELQEDLSTKSVNTGFIGLRVAYSFGL